MNEVDAAAVEWGTRLAEHLVRRLHATAADRISQNGWEAVKKRVLRTIRGEGPNGSTRLALTRRTQYLSAGENARR